VTTEADALPPAPLPSAEAVPATPAPPEKSEAAKAAAAARALLEAGQLKAVKACQEEIQASLRLHGVFLAELPPQISLSPSGSLVVRPGGIELRPDPKAW